MSLKILIAENNEGWLKTTSKFLKQEKFEIISAKNPDEAKLVFDNNPGLAAIIIDGRLTNDDNDKDHSGWELGYEAQRRGVARAPIIMYSRFEKPVQFIEELSGQETSHHLPRISYVAKDDRSDALVAKVLEEITRNLREAPALEKIPRFHQPPIIAFAPNNGVGQLTDELRKGGETAEIRSTLAELEKATTLYPSAMYVVDVAAVESSAAISLLNKRKSISEQSCYIVGLTSNDDFRNEVSERDVNAFVTKRSPQTDALELIMQMFDYRIQLEKIARSGSQTQLALTRYGELLTALQELKQSAEPDVSSVLEILEAAMSWPLLKPNENLIITALYLQLLKLREEPMDEQALDLCIEGTKVLAKDRAAATGDVQDWIERAQKYSPDFTLTWLDDEALSGDIDESND